MSSPTQIPYHEQALLSAGFPYLNECCLSLTSRYMLIIFFFLVFLFFFLFFFFCFPFFFFSFFFEGDETYHAAPSPPDLLFEFIFLFFSSLPGLLLAFPLSCPPLPSSQNLNWTFLCRLQKSACFLFTSRDFNFAPPVVDLPFLSLQIRPHFDRGIPISPL